MSVDAKLFVTCGKDKATEVGQAVVEALRVYVLQIIEENEYRFSERREQRVSLPSVVSYDFEIFRIVFGNGDGDNKSAQKRMLSMLH